MDCSNEREQAGWSSQENPASKKGTPNGVGGGAENGRRGNQLRPWFYLTNQGIETKNAIGKDTPRSVSRKKYLGVNQKKIKKKIARGASRQGPAKRAKDADAYENAGRSEETARESPFAGGEKKIQKEGFLRGRKKKPGAEKKKSANHEGNFQTSETPVI